MKKKLYIMINSLSVGGAEKSLVSMLSLMDYTQYDVYLQMIHRGGAFEQLLPAEVIVLPMLDFISFCNLSTREKITHFNYGYISMCVKIRQSLRENNSAGHQLHDTQAYWRAANHAFPVNPDSYDVAVAWGQGTPTHYVAEKINAGRKIAWINADYEAVGHNEDFDRSIYQTYRNIVCVSDGLSEKMRNIYPAYKDKIITVLDINCASVIQQMAEENATLPQADGALIVTVGRLVPQKGYDLAVGAASELVKRGIKFCWLVIGEGPERKKLERRISAAGLKNNFVLLGTKTNPYPFIKAADVYVQTSRYEGYCLTLAEARIMNRPCVSTNFDVVYDQLQNEVNGLIAEMNPSSIADAIERMLKDEALKNRIIDNVRNEKKGNEEELDKIYQLFN